MVLPAGMKIPMMNTCFIHMVSHLDLNKQSIRRITFHSYPWIIHNYYQVFKTRLGFKLDDCDLITIQGIFPASIQSLQHIQGDVNLVPELSEEGKKRLERVLDSICNGFG